MGQKLYWGVAVLAFILSAFFIPQFVTFEWGVGAYIAIAWGVFLVVFGIVSYFAPNLQAHFEGKKNDVD